MISLHHIFVAIVHLQLEAACGQYAEPNRKTIRSVFSATLVHAGPGAGFFVFLIPFCRPLYYALPTIHQILYLKDLPLAHVVDSLCFEARICLAPEACYNVTG